MNDKIYFILNNEVHNINDVEYQSMDDDIVNVINKKTKTEELVIIHTIDEIINLIKKYGKIFDENQTYWNDQGKFKKEYDQLEKFIPANGWDENNDTYINMLIAASNMYYRYYNDGDKEISEYNSEKLNEGISKYKEDFSKYLENITHFQDEYYYIDNEYMLEDIINAIIQIGIKEKLVAITE